MAIKVTNLAKLYTLLLLSKHSMHGYELMKRLEAILGKKPSASAVYPFLIALAKHNFVEAGHPEKREKTTYRMTRRGHKFVSEVLEQFSGAVDAIIDHKLVTCAHCNCRVYSGAHIESIKGRKTSFCCIKCAQSYKDSGK